MYELVYNEKIRFYSNYLQNLAKSAYLDRVEWLSKENERREKKSRDASIRFKGKKRTKESIEKSSAGLKKWIMEHPEEHKNKMNKINKNPDKIQKTANKHRGMKRSHEARMKMSKAKEGFVPTNKGKIYAYDPTTLKAKHFDNKEIVPENYIIGMPSRRNDFKWYNKEGKIKKIYYNEEVPEGWNPGRGPRQ